MGNSVIIKPAEQSSLSLIRLAKLTKEAGVPDGVFNVLPGYGEVVGKALGLHKGIDGIFFTGSSEVGKMLLSYSASSNMKRVGLECGGKSPLIVTRNCKDIVMAAKVAAENIFYNQGQICFASSRLIVDSKVYDEFLNALYFECEKYTPGNPYDSECEVGCVVSKEQFDRINAYIQLAKEENAVIFSAKKRVDESYPNAYCIPPTIISGISNDSPVSQEEVFGPVAVVFKFDSVEDAIEMANDTRYGLAGGVFTDDLNEAYYISNKIDAGLVHVNSWGEDQNITPFGGIKESGIGKDRSMFAFDEYSQLKTIWIKFQK